MKDKDWTNKDKNRTVQSNRAKLALQNGYHHAIRHAQHDACNDCLDRDGEVIDIMLVITRQADHQNGHCTWTFIR